MCKQFKICTHNIYNNFCNSFTTVSLATLVRKEVHIIYCKLGCMKMLNVIRKHLYHQDFKFPCERLNSIVEYHSFVLIHRISCS